MRTIEVEGVRIEMNPCECGARCTDEQAIQHLRDWDDLLKICAFCGKPIRITQMRLNHVHKSEVDEEAWGVTYDPMEHEQSYDWSGNGPLGWFEIVAHPECAKRGMPYADFEKRERDYPRVIPPGVAVPRAQLLKCQTCGDEPTVEDLRQAAGQVYSYYGPCSYCNKPIKVFEIELEHGPRIKKEAHVDWWHWKSYIREASLHWWGYSFKPGEYRQIDFYGHLACIMRKMPYCKWGELERVFAALVIGSPELINPQVKKYVSIKVAEGAQACWELAEKQIEHMVLVTLQDLKGPREWVPGLAK